MLNTNESPSVSVVMPVYNAEQTVRSAVDSIRNQTLRDWELVAVDDGSTDHSGELLDQLAGQEPAMKVLHPGRRGVVEATNIGIHEACGRYIARMDADDVSYPQRLETQCRFLDTNTNVDLVGSRVVFGGHRQKAAGFAAYVDWANNLVTAEQIKLNRFVELPVPNPSVMFRYHSLERYGAYRDCGVPEDYELILRWLDQDAVINKVAADLLTWNDPPDRLSRTHSRYAVEAFYRCKAYYVARWLALNNPWHPEVVIWGAGRTTRKRAEMLAEQGIRINAYIDVNPRKIGGCIHGRPVWSAERLPSPETCFVVSYVGRRGARADVRSRLNAAGYLEGQHYILC